MERLTQYRTNRIARSCKTFSYFVDGTQLRQYINAETSAGGQAHWITTEIAGTLRTNDTDWHEAWLPYIQGVINQTLPNQVDKGGPVIGLCSFRNRLIFYTSSSYSNR